MNQEKRSLFQRIRNARQSLDNAEKSFQDDKEMRGELDLMLAEAELKNLRNKQTFPWSWNRHSLAFCAAVLLTIAGIGGWYYGREDMQREDVQPQTVTVKKAEEVKSSTDNNKKDITSGANRAQQNINSTPVTEKEKSPGVRLSDKDMRQLVRSAKNELSNGM